MKLHGCFGDAQWCLWAQQHKSLGPPGRDGPQSRASSQQAGRVATAPGAALGGHCPYLHPPSTLLGLPPSMLVSSPCAEQPAAPSCADFFHLVNSELVGVEQVRSGAGLGVMWALWAGSGESSGVHLWSHGASGLGMGPTCMRSLRIGRGTWSRRESFTLLDTGSKTRDRGQCPLWKMTPSQNLPRVIGLGPRSADRPARFTSGHRSQTVPTPGSSGSKGCLPLLVHSQGWEVLCPRRRLCKNAPCSWRLI